MSSEAEPVNQQSAQSNVKDSSAEQAPARSEFPGAAEAKPAVGRLRKIVDGIKDVKEVVGALLFFAAGVLWVVSYFATKSQLGEIRCLMQAQIDLNRAETDLNLAGIETVNVGIQQDELKRKQQAGGSLTYFENVQLQELQARLEHLRKRREDAQDKANEVRSDLVRNACAGK